MKISTVLFDLDGTLLPIDQEVFTKTYFKALAAKIAPLGYEPQKLVDAVWAGTAAMVKNDGSKTNERVFWETFAGIFGEKVYSHIPRFEEFYRVDFACVKKICGFNPCAGEVISRLKGMGVRLVLASNPIFPMVAQQSRMIWAGVSPSDFELITAYENSSACKPNPAYYSEIANKLEVSPDECLMVGNDVREDMVAELVGMKVFLMTDYLLNKDGADVNEYPRGGFKELCEFIEKLRLT